MKVTVFTSNQPRHISLINKLTKVFGEVCAVVECTTVFPGETDDFYKKTIVMQEYFKKVTEAEKKYFQYDGIKGASLVKPIKAGDLNHLNLSALSSYLNSDVYIIFGASYIKGDLCDFLVENHALNIHMGVSPYYRGSGCNFWALYDNNPRLVGATIHKLSSGLDSGDIVSLAFPSYREDTNGFELGMAAVAAAQECVVELISNNDVRHISGVRQDKKLEIRCSRYVDFTDDCVIEYQNMLKSRTNRLSEEIKKSEIIFPDGIKLYNLN